MNPTYRRLFGAQVVALAGTGLTTIALTLLAYDLAGDDAGAVVGGALTLRWSSTSSAPRVITALAGRLPRRRLVVALDALRAGSVLGMVFATASRPLITGAPTATVACMSERNERATSGRRRRIGIYLFGLVEEIDAIGPWEVFAWWTNAFPDDGWEATTFSKDGEPVTGDNTLVVHPNHSVASVPMLDVLLHPGGDGHLKMIEDEAHLGWLREQKSRVPLMTSVCTGSIVFAAAGLLRGRPATSHRNSLDHMVSIDPTIEPRPARGSSMTATSSPLRSVSRYAPDPPY